MTELLTALAVIFIVAGPFVLLANRLQLSAVPALIVSGLIAGLFIEEDLELALARLGIALLVFTFAVKIHTESVRTVVTDPEIVSITQAVIVGALGFAGGVLVGLTPEQSLYVGIAAALSSTIVGTALFQSPRKDLVRDRLSASINSVQDLLAIFVLLILGAGAFAADPIATQLGYGVMLLVAAVVVNRYCFDWIARLAKGSDESMLIGIIALLIVFLAIAEYVGISIVVGAFAAGIAIRDDPVAYSNVLNGLESVKDFFAAIFFVTVGALVTIPTLEALVVALLLFVLTALVKPAIIIALLILNGYDRRSATLVGFDLDHVGELGIIVAIEALVLGILATTVFDGIILAAAVTMILSSFTWYYDEELYRFLVSHGLLGRARHTVDDWNTVPADLEDHVVIVGYGRQGRRLVTFCEEVDHPYVVVENDPALLDDLRADCTHYVLGDAIEAETWQAARLTDARLVVSTVTTKPLTDHLLSFTDAVDVIVRTEDVTAAPAYIDRGAVYVSIADLLAADHLAEQIEALIDGRYDPAQLRERSERELEIHSEPARPSTGESTDMF